MTRANALYDLLKEIFLLLDDGDRQLLTEFNLTVPRYYALYHIGERPGLSISDLSNLMFCDKSNITRLIKAMESENLVTRVPHETDGRALRLYLTPSGEAMRDAVLKAHRARNRQRFHPYLNGDGRDALLEHLAHLKQNLEVDLGRNGHV